MEDTESKFGQDDQSYKAAGELAGITKLVEQFYKNMDSVPEAKTIREMHPADISESSKKLTYFLSGWLGGPKLYSQHYKPIGIPTVHRHLDIGEAEADAWLFCMKKAIDDQPYEDSFKDYLITQLRVPAGRIRQVCAKN